MGSVLFPLFKIFYGAEDEDGTSDGMNSSELAWRTVFVVPAVVALVTSYVIVFHCDDSPKGDYRERVRQQEIMVVNPAASLCTTFMNTNVLVLLLQYACCFGVEVTMTNATALYYKDEFGQTTVSAAAIASVFGIMNLFARGIGGFISDMFNAKYGMRGRIMWQSVTLFLEGAAIIVFAYSQSLPGSIVSLVFLSLMVQSAEGSTFGIVPYVDRRFTGTMPICRLWSRQCVPLFIHLFILFSTSLLQYLPCLFYFARLGCRMGWSWWKCWCRLLFGPLH